MNELIMVLGHFAETDNEMVKEHYVCLSLSPSVIRHIMQFLAQKAHIGTATVTDDSRPGNTGSDTLNSSQNNDLASESDMHDKTVDSSNPGGPYAPLLDYPKVWSAEQWLRWQKKLPWLRYKNELLAVMLILGLGLKAKIFGLGLATESPWPWPCP